MRDLVDYLGLRFTVIDDFGALTPAEFAGEVEALIAALTRLDCGPDSNVGLMCRNSRYFVLTIQASRVLGFQVHCLSTEYTPGQIEELAGSAPLDLLVCDSEFTDRVPGGLPVLVADRRQYGASPSPGPDELPRERRPARYVTYTSGTEGKPKPVGRSGAASADDLRSLLSIMPITGDMSMLCAAPLFHAWGLLHMWLAFSRGGEFILPLYYDPYEILDLVREHRPQAIVTVPVVLRNMVEVLSGHGAEPLPARALEALTVIAVAGSALPRNLAEKTIEVFGPRLYSLYGSTEAGWVSVATPDDLGEHPDTAGRPVGSVTVVIRDATGSPRGPGELGRITVASGLSAKDTGAAGYLDTGDVGSLDDEGRLFVRGRADDMIVIGAENVYPIEIEGVLLQHPGIADAAVVARHDDEYGQRLAAVVVGKPDTRVTSAEVMEWLRSRIPTFKLPQDIVFADEIPRNAAGKIMRAAIRTAPADTVRADRGGG